MKYSRKAKATQLLLRSFPEKNLHEIFFFPYSSTYQADHACTINIARCLIGKQRESQARLLCFGANPMSDASGIARVNIERVTKNRNQPAWSSPTVPGPLERSARLASTAHKGEEVKSRQIQRISKTRMSPAQLPQLFCSGGSTTLHRRNRPRINAQGQASSRFYTIVVPFLRLPRRFGF